MALCHVSENAQQSHFKIVVKTPFPFANSYTNLIGTGDGCCHKAAAANMCIPSLCFKF